MAITIEHQDRDIILFNPYTYTGALNGDGLYIKRHLQQWNGSVVNDDYKVLFSRPDQAVIQIVNEFYGSVYQAIEPSLVGDVLILGMGLAHLDMYLTTGSSWKWVEINNWLANNIVVNNGTVHEGDAEDEEFIASLGTFDTILIDFPQTQLNDFEQHLNMGGTIIEIQI